MTDEEFADIFQIGITDEMKGVKVNNQSSVYDAKKQHKYVWIVLEPTYNGYGDYSIVGIYSTKELAEKYCEDNFKIEEWKIDE